MSSSAKRGLDSASTGRKAPEGSEAQLKEYNYPHFWPKHLLADLFRSAKGEGLRGGQEAPEFDLESTEGQRIRLSDLRGKPVLLHFGSYT